MIAPFALDVPTELLREMSVPGPRYTSYPTAPSFAESFGAEAFAGALGRFAATDRPLSLYVHLPFCRSLCLFCACNVVITRKEGVAARYLDALEREVETAASFLGPRPRRVTQLHLGGGTPTYLTVPELERLHGMLARRFEITGDEVAIEVDPRVTTREQLEALARLGWNRVSMGVQDFADDVQHAINRVQPVELTRSLVETARGLGYRGINVDLIYGLPLQKLETFARTVEEVVAIHPDRIALYSYAHVPWLRPGQGGFELHKLPMPGPEEKYALFRAAVTEFGRAGYVHLGMDHFALPDDELALALDRGTLHRNFQGYTVRRADDLLGLGVSAISDLAGCYAQNEKELERYEAAARAGRLATVRGYLLSEDDRARRRAIQTIMCGGRLPADLARRFAADVERLAPLERKGLVRRDPETGEVAVTPLGRVFVRNIAMVFDAYLKPGEARFSKTV